MTIAASETAVQSSDIFEVYDFALGADHYYYTSDFVTHIVDGITFEAESVERSAWTYPADNSPRVCTITLPNTNTMAALLRMGVEMKSLKVSITRYFSDDPTTPETLFVGYATGVNFAGGVCTVEFKTILLELERQICRVRMQALCNNTLFDSVCALAAATYQISASVTVDVTEKVLSSATFGAQDDGYFQHGKILFNDTYRFVSSHVGNDITIQYPFDGLVDGNSVTAWPGCDKDPATCQNKFNNLSNYVGMPYIPLKDSEQVALTNG